MNPRPNRFFHLSLIMLVGLNLIPHFSDHTVPTLAVGGLCLVWRLMYEYQYVPLPNVFTKIGLVATLTYLVYNNYGQILGLESGSALLICAVSLKLVDRVEYRDAMVLLFLNFMLLLARFFESQSLGITIFAGFDLIITTALLVQLHNGESVKFDFTTLLKTGGKLFLQITPFMILLFFVFPRFSTGLLQARSNKPALDGFSNTMEPGAMSRLAQTDQPAFRTRFFDKIPSPTEMYWRGGILTVSRNMKWEKGQRRKALQGLPDERKKRALRHEILQEPVFQDWLFTLDRGLRVEFKSRFMQRRVRVTEGAIFSTHKPQDKKLLYEAYSLQEVKESLDEEQRKKYLQVPEQEDTRIQELVDRISSGGASNELKAGRLMKFYQTQFRYTLNPGALSTLDLAEFMFEKKVGFCEHFAVSFASVMRLANVPARVVVGFQGGRKNNLSDYYLVTSKDAHAWTEVWSDEKKQWIRFDPTVMVAPLRFELGGDIFFSLSDDQIAQAGDGKGFLDGYELGWLQQGSFALDALATNWNMFLLNYDRSGQQDFFSKLGFKNINQGLLLSLSLLLLLVFFLWVRVTAKKGQKPEPPEQKAYLALRAFLARKGIEKESFEGPSDFLTRAQEQYPEKKNNLEDFRKEYLQAHYGQIPSKGRIQALLKQIL